MNENRQTRRLQIQHKIQRLQVELEYLDKLDQLESQQERENSNQSAPQQPNEDK